MSTLVSVTGSRCWENAEVIHESIIHHRPDFLIHGGAIGADRIAERVALATGIPRKVYLPNWTRFGKAAGFHRNEEMLRAGIRAKRAGWEVLVLAFPKGRAAGTNHMRTICTRAGLTVITIPSTEEV